MRLTRPGRAVVITTTALLGLPGFLLGARADAAITGAGVSAAQVISSGSWILVPSLTSTPPATPGALTVAVTLIAPAYFYAINTGTEPLTGAEYTVSASSAVTLTACVGGSWNETTNLCSGTATVVGATTGSPATSSVVPTPNDGNVLLQASTTAASTSATISTSVRSDQISGIGTTNS
ncbi:MAG TPA: hypothetical protein VNG13_15990 [Mycobacteriales bacterium]|nr:hypothetical protein [Mycobacteriales bacterium]